MTYRHRDECPPAAHYKVLKDAMESVEMLWILAEKDCEDGPLHDPDDDYVSSLFLRMMLTLAKNGTLDPWLNEVSEASTTICWHADGECGFGVTS